MSLFSYARQGSPADRARELLFDYHTLVHDALSWRADSLRTLAEGIDRLRDELERGLDDIATELARGVGEDHPEERDELGTDDDGERR